MKRIAFTNAPHPITGYQATLEIFDAGQDTVMRCTADEPRIGRDTIIYPDKHAEAVMRETGLFWTLDAETPPPAPVQIVPVARGKLRQKGASAEATVTVYDDGTGRALLQRVDPAGAIGSLTWKSPYFDAEGWIAHNSETEWERLDPASPAPVPDDDGFTADPNHVHFEASHLSMGWAVTYAQADRVHPDGRRSMSLRFPLFIASEYLSDAEETCRTAAAILERNKAEMGAK